MHGQVFEKTLVNFWNPNKGYNIIVEMTIITFLYNVDLLNQRGEHYKNSVSSMTKTLSSWFFHLAAQVAYTWSLSIRASLTTRYKLYNNRQSAIYWILSS
ncbi:hypothetical protein BCR43DRAFT_90017 [Syncephalastrum racemosum]|uniref:Uncharacterized protein n=1 Tax=Syncephalastrum racemosum TaxID=13706 RepID=A0A1X2H3Q9_SYNRA|nr:hypothetical protein BCR43DRAFT_90017 [Syncephalastrum racemosum]